MSRCQHPLASLELADSKPPQVLICTKCQNVIPTPAKLQPRRAPRRLVETVRDFIHYVETAAQDTAPQFNPRHEMSLILAMNNALNDELHKDKP